MTNVGRSDPAAAAHARRLNERVMAQLESRAAQPESVLAPSLQRYVQSSQHASGRQLLSNLTSYLLAAYDETRRSIEDRMQRKWPGDLQQAQRSITNSLRRSAGTNYQALVSYALATYLLSTNSCWYLSHPVPPAIRSALAIRFTAGVSPPPGSDEPQDSTDIQPDVDVLLRNAAWQAGRPREPVFLLSVKTSLVDRAGMAARWKTYFDLVMNPCPLESCDSCAYSRLGIKLVSPDLFVITHGIVTANIYKYFFSDVRYRTGELESGQTASNTYMFDLKYTTRDDGIAVTPAGWDQFETLPDRLDGQSRSHNLPL